MSESDLRPFLVLDRAAESLEELQSRDAHFRKEGVDVTGDEESYFHGCVLRVSHRRPASFAASWPIADQSSCAPPRATSV